MARRTRFLRVASFDALGSRLVAVDEDIPVVVEVDPLGGVVATHTWDLDTALRGRPTAKDVVLTPTTIVVASPAAGGLVRIDRASGDVRVIRLPDDVGWLRADGNLIWAVADPDRPSAHDDFRKGTGRRPVVWEEPTEEDTQRRRQRMSAWKMAAPDSDGEWVPMVNQNDPIPTADDWGSTDDDGSDLVPPPTPVWRVVADDVTPVDFGGELEDLVSVDQRVVAVCRLPTDPLIKRVEPGGYVSYIRPGTILHGPVAQLRPVGTVGETLQGSIFLDGQNAWLLGFNRERDDEVFEVCSVDIGTGEVSPSQGVDEEVVAVAGGRFVHLGWTGGRHWDENEDEEPQPRSRQLRIAAGPGGAEEQVVEIPVVDISPVVDGATVWFRRYDSPRFVGLDLATGELHDAAVDTDLTQFVPPVTPPQGVDLASYETEELEKMRGSLLGGWRSDSDEEHRFIGSVVFESVELKGKFPHTALVARFRAVERLGALLGRRWNLYDELGNVEPLEYADMHLMEDICAAGYGLPPPDQCVPDEDGVVWF